MSSDKQGISLKSKLLAAVVVLVGLVLPLQFWHSVWFGRSLDSEELRQYLGSVDHPRKIQHALSQIDERIRAGDSEVGRLYDQVAALSQHPLAEVRSEAAWVMGQDNQSEVFLEALVGLLEDPDPAVRRNAALALVRFADRRALPELRRMLQPVSITAPADGQPIFLVREGAAVSAGDLVAEVGAERVAAPFAGRIVSTSSDDTAKAGQEIAAISPDPRSVWEALRGLYLLGGETELDLVERIERDPRYREEIRKQAAYTRQAIERRIE